MSVPKELIPTIRRILDGHFTNTDELFLQRLFGDARASGERSLAINGDANGATIATGDGNIILNVVFQKDSLRFLETDYQGEGAKMLRSLLQEILEPKVEIDWPQVSRKLLDQQIQRLTSNPLTHAEGIAYDTDQVYIPLGLVERKRQSRRGRDVPPEQGSQFYEETEITQQFEHEEFLEQVLKQGHSPRSSGRRLAVIGEPGAGKTTLLQQMARWVSDNIDGSIVIWISLADSPGEALEEYLLEQWLKAAVQQAGKAEASPQVKDVFMTQLQQGKVWLMLDGVDEMPIASGNPLSAIERQVRLGGLLCQIRIILTCRLNLWDGYPHGLDTFDTYRTLEFSYPDQVESFIKRWFENLPDTQAWQAESLCSALSSPGKERIRDLVKNPLRLTLLCFNGYLGGGELPETKAGLYEHFVEDFYTWKREQFPTTAEQRKRLNSALGKLAREAIDKEETRFRLRHDFVCRFLGDFDESKSLFQLALNLGWLNKIGVAGENRRMPVYAFFHPTFQEYFSALEINDFCYFLRCRGENFNTIETLETPNHSHRIFDLFWKEVFILWIGRRDILNEQKEEAIRKLIEFNDSCGKLYRLQAYLVAATSISEFPIKEKLADIVLGKIITGCFGEINHSSAQSKILPRGIRESFKKVLLKTYHSNMANKLLEALTEEKNEEIIKEISESILTFQSGNKKAVKCLIKLFQTSTDSRIIQSVLEVFEKTDLGESVSEVREILKASLNASLDLIFGDFCEQYDIPKYFQIHQFDPFICIDVVRALNSIDPDSSGIGKDLLEILLHRSKDDRTICLIADQLLDINYNNFLARKTLGAIRQSSSDDEAKFWATLSLAENDSEKIGLLEDLIDNCKDIDTVIHISEELLELKSGNMKAVDALVEILDDEYSFERYYAANVLLTKNLKRKRAYDTLLDLAESDETSIRRHAAEALGKMNFDCEIALDVLLKDLLCQSGERQIFPLPEMCISDLLLDQLLGKVIAGLKKCLQQKTGWVNRGACYDALWSYAIKTPYPVFCNAWNNEDEDMARLKEILE
jgi:energy-coupling factor transporter ATP-binding protein EcfA2